MFILGAHKLPKAPKSLGLTSDVASVCVAPIGKINMAEDSTPVSSEQKRPVEDDMRKLSEDGKVEQKEYLVCFSFFVFLFFACFVLDHKSPQTILVVLAM